MKCECGQDLRVANNKLVSPKETDKIKSVMTLVCVNPDCKLYAGTDLNNPKKVAKVVENEL